MSVSGWDVKLTTHFHPGSLAHTSSCVRLLGKTREQAVRFYLAITCLAGKLSTIPGIYFYLSFKYGREVVFLYHLACVRLAVYW
jgi:hypothetical protein